MMATMPCISTTPPHPCGHTQNVNTRQHCCLIFCRYIGWFWWFWYWDFLFIPRRHVEAQILVYSKLIPLNLQHWISSKINQKKVFLIYFLHCLSKYERWSIWLSFILSGGGGLKNAYGNWGERSSQGLFIFFYIVRGEKEELGAATSSLFSQVDLDSIAQKSHPTKPHKFEHWKVKPNVHLLQARPIFLHFLPACSVI